MILDIAFLLVVGLAIGAYGTIIGIGGGILLVPLLLLLYPTASPESVTSISMAFVLVNSLSGASAYARQKRIDYRTGIIFAAATIPGTIVGVWTIQFISKETFSLIFGLLMIALAVFLQVRPHQVVTTPRATGKSRRALTDSHGQKYVYAFNLPAGIALSFGAGFLAGLLGIGGGIVHVPSMVYLLGFPTHIATATSQFILVFTALAGSLTHAAGGIYTDIWQMVLWLAVGAIPGAHLGAWLSRRLQSSLIIRLLALAVAIMGIRLFVLALFG